MLLMTSAMGTINLYSDTAINESKILKTIVRSINLLKYKIEVGLEARLKDFVQTIIVNTIMILVTSHGIVKLNVKPPTKPKPFKVNAMKSKMIIVIMSLVSLFFNSSSFFCLFFTKTR